MCNPLVEFSYSLSTVDHTHMSYKAISIILHDFYLPSGIVGIFPGGEF